MSHRDCPLDCQFTHDRTTAHLMHHIERRIPTHLTYQLANAILPQRSAFIHKQLGPMFKKQVAAGKPLLFLPNQINEAHEYRNNALRYIIHMFGVLPCGSKTCVILEDIPVYMDVMVPIGAKHTTLAFMESLRDIFTTLEYNYQSLDVVKMYSPKGFQKFPRDYIRISTNTLMDRRKFIEYFNRENARKKADGQPLYETASDDFKQREQSYYFPKVAREQRFATADWNRVTDYTTSTDTKADYTLRINYANLTKLGKKKRAEIMAAGGVLAAAVERDPTMHDVWDIETYSTGNRGRVPQPTDDDFYIFMMCQAFFWHHSNVPLLTVNVVSFESRPVKHTDTTRVDVTIQCDNEYELLQAHMMVVSKMQPDIMTAFNGGAFDWPMYREKVKRAGLLVKLKDCYSCLPLNTRGSFADNDDRVWKYSFKSEKIKIDAESSHLLDCVAQFPGMVDTDAMPVFLKLYTRMEVRKAASLNFFLQKNGLESKFDMPIKRMFKIVERSIALKTCNRGCHCGEMPACPVCTSFIKEIDCPPIDNGDSLDDEYDIANPYPHTTQCCACGKRPQNLEDMKQVGDYCVIDCIRPHQLYVKRAIIPEKRELSTMSYVSIVDSFFRADGMKVCNLIGAYSHRRLMAYSNGKSFKHDSEKDHYPGAHVFIPETKLHNDFPITGLDFSSLYPSLMRTYNYSPDMIVYTKEERDKLHAEGYTLHHIKPFAYERGEKRGDVANQHCIGEGWTVRHNGVIKDSDTHIVTGYEKIMDNSRVKYQPQYGREALPGERIGIFAFIVGKLFDKRVPIKAEFVRLEAIREKMEKDNLEELNGIHLHDVHFQIVKANSKQYAIKILANTFYGKSGDFRAQIYELLVAAGITTAGQYNIKLVADFVRSKGFKVCYGDTDSLYLKAPAELYTEFTDEYTAGMEALQSKYNREPIPAPVEQIDIDYKQERVALRLVYWNQMVAKTMIIMNVLKQEVSDFLLAENNTTLMNMAYEEVGFPTVLTGKKKYYMIAHMKEINFYPKDIFIRGIDIIKQGQAKITKMLGEEFMRESLAPENERDLIEIAEDMIRKFYKLAESPDANMFAVMGRYRPEKKNVSVQVFVARMKQLHASYRGDPIMTALYEPPEAGDKFMYVMVEREQQYNMDGTIIKMKKGDQMEYMRVYLASQETANPLKLDLNYYMAHGIVGIFARFIASNPKFKPPGQWDLEDKEDYRKMDIAQVDLASKYLLEMCNQITGFNPLAQRAIGARNRGIYRLAKCTIDNKLGRVLGGSTWLLSVSDTMPDEDTARTKHTVDIITARAHQIAESVLERKFEAKKYITKCLISPIKLRVMYIQAQRVRDALLTAHERDMMSKLYASAYKLNDVVYKFNLSIMNLITDLRCEVSEESIAIPDDRIAVVLPDSEQQKILKDTYALMLKIAGLYVTRGYAEHIVDELNEQRSAIVSDGEIKPEFNPRAEARVDAKLAAVIPEYQWE